MFALILCALLVSSAQSARILGVFMTPSYSHQVIYQPIWKELSLRGHEVTILTPNPLNDPTLTNLTEVDLSFTYQIWDKQGVETLGTQQHSTTEELQALYKAYSAVSDAQLSHPAVQKYISRNNSMEFDLILVEYVFPIMFAFKDIYNCPMIGITSVGLTSPGYDAIGNPNHPALNPDFTLPFSQKLTFKERVISTVFKLLFKASSTMKIHPKLHTLAKKYFGPDIRRMDEISREVSMIIVNSNYAIHNIKPTVPAYVEISGIHIKPRKPLPKDLQKYLDDAKEGVVYFSLGSNIKSKLLPPEKLNTIVQALGELPYKVLWKFEDENLLNKPKNVEIRKWLPQQDVLAHPNIKLFVFQGGLQSYDEAIHYKVPLLAIPFFGDQRYNAHRLVESEAGLSINFHTMTKDELKEKIIEIASNPKYKKKMVKLSSIVSDQPMPALDKAVYWIEYVIRHDGAEHLRYAALDMPFYQYYLIDVIGFILALAYSALFVLRRILRHVVLCYNIFRRFLFEFFQSSKSHSE